MSSKWTQYKSKLFLSELFNKNIKVQEFQKKFKKKLFEQSHLKVYKLWIIKVKQIQKILIITSLLYKILK